MTKLKKVAFATISAGMVLGAIFASAQTAGFQFTQNLKLGSSGPQVLELQKTLNSNGFVISTSGIGSVGMETSYFGAKTKVAVAKFQAANKLPATGNVFALTRAALNTLSGGTVVNPGTGVSTSSPVVSGAVTVGLATVQPNTVIVASSSHVKLADVVFSGNGVVSSLKLMRMGISNSSTLKNVYLYDGGVRITDSSSVLTDGTINFAGAALFTVSGSKTISVYADIDPTQNTSGQSVGVSVVGYATAGNPMAVVSGLNGPILPIGSVTIVTATVATTSANTNPNVGDLNVNLWSANVSLSRDSYVNGGTFKLVGSAPVSSFANVKLLVDNVQVGNAAVIDAAGNISFTANQFLRAGTHSVSVHADVVGGAGRTYYVSLQQGSDLLFQDAQVSGAFAMATLTGGSSFYNLRLPVTDATIASCSTSGSSCANIYSDSTFSSVTVPSGSSQQTIGSYTFNAFGEPVKLLSANVDITGSAVSSASISNVSVYVNGVQISSGASEALNSSQNTIYLSNLGGTIVNPGSPVTILVKADIRDTAGNNLPTQTLTTKISNLQIQGQQSFNTQTLVASGINSNSVTVGSLNISFSANTNLNGVKAASSASNVLVGSFILSAGTYEGATLTGVDVTLTPGSNLDLSTVSGLSLVDTTSSTTIGTKASVGSGPNAATLSFSSYLNIPAGTSKTLNVYANFSNAVSQGTLNVSGKAYYQGLVSLATGNTSTFSATTTIVNAGLASIARSASSLSARYVVGGTVNNTGVFTLTATGTSFMASKLHFVVSNPSLVSGLAVNGVNGQSQGNGLYTVDLSSSPISITTIGTDIPVTVTFNSANKDNNSYASTSATVGIAYVYGNTGSSIVTVGTDFTATGGTATVIAASATSTATSSSMTLMGAMPKVQISNNTVTTSGGSTLSNQSVGTVTITPVGGTVSVANFKVNLPANVTYTSARLVDSSGSIVTGATVNITNATGTVTFANTTGNISSPVSYTVQVSGTVSSSVTGSISIGASLGDVSTLTWSDLTGGISGIVGNSLLTNYNN